MKQMCPWISGIPSYFSIDNQRTKIRLYHTLSHNLQHYKVMKQ